MYRKKRFNRWINKSSIWTIYIKKERKKNKGRLNELPKDINLKEDFYDSFIDMF